MSWGVPRRPKISTKLGNPNPREGSDGDIQIKGTALGAKLWGKWLGRWWDVPLSRDGITKFGVTDSNYLSIDRDSVDIYSNRVKVASFGETTTVKDIYLTGKIDNTDGDGNNIIIGQDNPVSADNSDDDHFKENVIIGSGAGKIVSTVGGDQFNLNVAIGYRSMYKIDPDQHSNNASSNVAIGHAAMLNFEYGSGNTAIGKGALFSTDGSGSNNIGIGNTAGGNITSGSGNVVIGDTDITADGDNQLIIASGGGDVTWLTGTSAGRIGIGTPSPDGLLEVEETSTGAGTGGILSRTVTHNGNAGIRFGTNGTDRWSITTEGTNGANLRFRDEDASAEYMRIDSSGNVFIGQSAQSNPSGNDVDGTVIGQTSGINSQAEGQEHKIGRGQDGTIISFYSAGGAEGSISISGSDTSYNDTSDYRLKENAVAISDGLERLNQLKPYRFNWKKHPNKIRDGFFAHEVSGLVPEAVQGEKDGLDDDGKEAYQQIDTGKLVPILVSAVQELSTKLDTMQTEINNLKAE